MFNAISPVAKLGKITLIVNEAGDGKLQVTFVQTPNKDNPVAIPARAWTGTPEELDQSVAAELAELANYRAGVIEDGLAVAKAAMEAAVKAEQEKASAKAAAKPVKSVSGTKPAPKSQPILAADDDEQEAGTDDSANPQPANTEAAAVAPASAEADSLFA